MDDDYDDYLPEPQNNENYMSQQEVADELGFPVVELVRLKLWLYGSFSSVY